MLLDKPFRHYRLAETIEGVKRSGVDLVAWRDSSYTAAGYHDDVGLYYLYPKLAQWFGWNVSQIDTFFYNSLLIISLLIGGTFLWLTWRDLRTRLYSIVALGLVVYFQHFKYDIYGINAYFTLLTVPPVIWWWKQRVPRVTGFYLIGVIGFLSGIFNLIRSHLGTSIILFILVVLYSQRDLLRKNIWIYLVILGIGFVVPGQFMKHVISNRDTYVKRVDPAFQSNRGSHPIWHTAYIGMGFLSNTDVAAYADSNAHKAVWKRDSLARIGSPKYAEILKSETLKFVTANKKLFLFTLLAKLAVIAFFLLIVLNISLLLLPGITRPNAIEVAFAMGLLFTSLNGLIAVPEASYLSGFIAFGGMYAVYVMGTAGERGISMQSRVAQIVKTVVAYIRVK